MNAKHLLNLYMLSLALALSVLAVYMPWWGLRTSSETEVVLGSSANVNFNLWGSVSTVLRLNRTRSVVLDISELVSAEQDLSALKNVLDVTSGLAISSVALTSILWVLTVFSIVKRPLIPRRIFNLLLIVVGFLLLAAPIYMFSSFYPLVPKLERFSSFDFPYYWVQIRPQQITYFWGSLGIPSGIGFPSYLVGSDFWIWGAGAGWFLSITSALILFSAFILSWQMAPRKVL